jgi:hypothetical protein
MTITTTQGFSQVVGLLLDSQETVSGLLVYSQELSDTIYRTLFATDTMALVPVPDWYVPSLPREVAQVGWDFETMGTDTSKRYSVGAWLVWLGRVAALPIQLIKSILNLARVLGPVGLFITWLLVMFPIVLALKIIRFLLAHAKAIYQFVYSIVQFILQLLEIAASLLPLAIALALLAGAGGPAISQAQGPTPTASTPFDIKPLPVPTLDPNAETLASPITISMESLNKFGSYALTIYTYVNQFGLVGYAVGIGIVLMVVRGLYIFVTDSRATLPGSGLAGEVSGALALLQRREERQFKALEQTKKQTKDT